MALGDLLGRSHALILGLVRQHRPLGHVADCVDAGHVRAPIGVR